MREFLGGFGDDYSDWDWEAYEQDENVSHRLFKCDDGEIYFYIGE